MHKNSTLAVLIFTRDINDNPEKLTIYARITVNGKRAEINIGNSYPVALWNAKISKALGRTLETKGTILVNKL
ncbi:hypothetical protein [Ulvibacterium marinum]|uniref:hypothetical protein n=1 Tax=Ulvibacterium marinum TaxID=2419782 RepID=UPI0024944D0B|nr:hypothetical protein [Ulvibacterium marinum]